MPGNEENGRYHNREEEKDEAEHDADFCIGAERRDEGFGMGGW